MAERIVIDLDTCIMAGECVYNHPDYFAFGDDDLPDVRRPDIVGDADRLHATQAIGVCPSGAISIVVD